MRVHAGAGLRMFACVPVRVYASACLCVCTRVRVCVPVRVRALCCASQRRRMSSGLGEDSGS